MKKIITYLILIRLRKILPKDDFFAMAFFLFSYGMLVYFSNRLFLKYSYFFLLSALDISLYHLNRKDINLLKQYKHFRALLLIEYTIYSLPFLMIYFVNYKFDFVGIHFLIILCLTLLSEVKTITVKYPFLLFDPFWHICFRKYKLFLVIPVVVFLNIMGVQYNNENLNVSSLFIISLIGCIPSFHREHIIHVKLSFFESNKYILRQIRVALYNISIIIIPLILCFIVLEKWELLVYLPLVYVFPIINILFKYSVFFNKFLQKIVFTLFIGNLQLGFPLLILPYLYYNSIKMIKKTQNVTD
jgi:hypothetical protein